ncbi:hypothetical protein BN903_47 [Halorubrum sp. AJ67]|nr:hypothetical protein BN903_47 [Halorubrum sp. AJ67]
MDRWQYSRSLRTGWKANGQLETAEIGRKGNSKVSSFGGSISRLRGSRGRPQRWSDSYETAAAFLSPIA